MGKVNHYLFTQGNSRTFPGLHQQDPGNDEHVPVQQHTSKMSTDTTKSAVEMLFTARYRVSEGGGGTGAHDPPPHHTLPIQLLNRLEIIQTKQKVKRKKIKK